MRNCCSPATTIAVQFKKDKEVLFLFSCKPMRFHNGYWFLQTWQFNFFKMHNDYTIYLQK